MVDINYIGNLKLYNRQIIINLDNGLVQIVPVDSVDDASLREYQIRTEEQLTRVKELLKERKTNVKTNVTPRKQESYHSSC